MEISIGKANQTIVVDFGALPKTAQDYVIKYGLTQCLNDAHSSVTAKEVPNDDERAEQAMALAEGKLEALLRGEVRAFGGRTGDPIKAEANRIAVLAVRNILRANGKKTKDYTAEQLAQARDNWIAKNPGVMETAKANVEKARNLSAASEVDLSDLIA